MNDGKELRAKLDLVIQELKSLDHWLAIEKTEIGKRIIEDQKERIDLIRAQYARIPINSPFSNSILAGIQGQEEEARSLLARISDAKNRKEVLDMEAEILLNDIKARETAPDREERFVMRKDGK